MNFGICFNMILLIYKIIFIATYYWQLYIFTIDRVVCSTRPRFTLRDDRASQWRETHDRVLVCPSPVHAPSSCRNEQISRENMNMHASYVNAELPPCTFCDGPCYAYVTARCVEYSPCGIVCANLSRSLGLIAVIYDSRYYGSTKSFYIHTHLLDQPFINTRTLIDEESHVCDEDDKTSFGREQVPASSLAGRHR